MKINVDGRDLQVFFEYSATYVERETGRVLVRVGTDGSETKEKEVVQVPVRVTSCGLREIPAEGRLQDGALLSEGATMCSPSDNFTKSYGRKAALDRALRNGEQSPFSNDKAARRKVWHEYLKTHRFTEKRGPLTEEEVARIETRLASRRRAEVVDLRSVLAARGEAQKASSG